MRTSASRSSFFRRAARCLASLPRRGLEATLVTCAEAEEALLLVRRWEKLGVGVGDVTVLRRRLWEGWGILDGDGDRGEANEAVEGRGGGMDGDVAWERRLEGRRKLDMGVVDRRDVGTLMRRPVAIEGAVFRDRGEGRNGRRGCGVFFSAAAAGAGASPLTMTQFLPRSSRRSVCRLLAAGAVGVEARLSKNGSSGSCT